MWWLVVGGVLVLLGGLLAWRAATKVSGERSSPAVGLVLAVGLGLVFWGVVSVVVGLVVRDR